jgi:recombination protein RecR
VWRTRRHSSHDTARTIERDQLFEEPIEELIEQFSKFPGIGKKSAQRMVFYLLKEPGPRIDALIGALDSVRKNVALCRRCFNYAAGELCSICADPRRDQTTICVVESPQDILAIERTAAYRGVYHVLGGALNPIEGIGPEQLRTKELADRVVSDDVKEVIIATNPNVEGEQTAMFLASQLRPLGVKVTRLASGLPVGADLEYADELTLGRALEWRRDI